ncbi:hypothetical protein LAX75_05355 [Listeria cossartiae]|uniref:hypothetical protein n=1 Tax=Listeria cossartiae TaxID=2838249 RepID=UPI001627FCC8|nr:hypothetical protein [Listeria cossartiae]MBC1570869.1 hypothetical protein [Listeria cossartiae subsp. cossartiae]MBC1986185.1 hypothetical protein [Listeria cossartiae subsp. cossartiae]MCD2224119.1 hypothetical protein [Listeria cossartiae]MCD2238796.1 hypothetical protein [Listeria cossartiae]
MSGMNMNKKRIIAFKLVVGLVLFVGCIWLIVSLIQNINWVENASMEDRTRYFLQRKYDDDWEKFASDIELDFDVQSGSNHLITSQFEISAQVRNLNDAYYTFTTKPFDELSKLVSFDVFIKDNITAHTSIKKNEPIYIYLSNSKERFELQRVNGKYQYKGNLENKLDFTVTDVAAKVVNAQEEYNSWLIQMTKNEISLKSRMRNIVILASCIILVGYLFLVIIRPVRKKKHIDNTK